MLLQMALFHYFYGWVTFPWASLVAQLVKNLPEMWETCFNPWFGKIPWRRERLPTPVFWPGEFHGLCSPWGRKESDTTKWLTLTLTIFPYIHMCHIFILSSVDGHLVCFHVLAIVNSILQWTLGSMYLFKLVFSGLMKEMGSLDHMVFLFFVFRNLLTVLYSGCTKLLSHEQYRSVPSSPHPISSIGYFWWWPFWTVWGDTSL